MIELKTAQTGKVGITVVCGVVFKRHVSERRLCLTAAAAAAAVAAAVAENIKLYTKKHAYYTERQ